MKRLTPAESRRQADEGSFIRVRAAASSLALFIRKAKERGLDVDIRLHNGLSVRLFRQFATKIEEAGTTEIFPMAPQKKGDEK